jgi:hypothetical protein
MVYYEHDQIYDYENPVAQPPNLLQCAKNALADLQGLTELLGMSEGDHPAFETMAELQQAITTNEKTVCPLCGFKAKSPTGLRAHHTRTHIHKVTKQGRKERGC